MATHGFIGFSSPHNEIHDYLSTFETTYPLYFFFNLSDSQKRVLQLQVTTSEIDNAELASWSFCISPPHHRFYGNAKQKRSIRVRISRLKATVS